MVPTVGVRMMRPLFLLRAVVLLASLRVSQALDNGLGLTPPMGYSSWNDCGSTVNESWVKRSVTYLIESGLAAKGWVHVNVDEGWMVGRDPKTREPLEDRKLFPSGMKALGAWVHGQDVPGRGKTLKYGLYTCRGPTQCSRPEYRERCLHTAPNPPACTGPHPDGHCGCEGSQRYEEIDGKWFAGAGADYLKEDSCTATQNHSQAFAQYAKMRDVLNKTGRPIFFSLCGWNPWYAPPDPSIGYSGGASLGNSWRIHGDGRNWGALSGAVNTMAALGNFTGAGGWNDPDLLIGPWCGIDHNQAFCGQSDSQARTQFTLWSLFPAPLLISQNLLQWSSYALETYSNEEVIALNQELNARAAVRLAGGDLVGPPARCERHTPGADSSDNCTNVWGRHLRSGEIAVAFVNNANQSRRVSCDTACFSRLGGGGVPLLASAVGYAVRDLWAHALMQPITSLSLSALVEGGGGQRLFRLTPLEWAPQEPLIPSHTPDGQHLSGSHSRLKADDPSARPFVSSPHAMPLVILTVLIDDMGYWDSSIFNPASGDCGPH